MARVSASSTPVASGTADTAGLAAAAGRRLLGVSAQEDAGSPAAAEAILRLGTSTSDPILMYLNFAASEAKTTWFGDRGIDASAGVYVDRVSGTTAFVLYWTTGE